MTRHTRQLFIFIIISTCFVGCHQKYVKKNGKIALRFLHSGNMEMKYAVLDRADTETFETIEHAQKFLFGKDKNHVYMMASILPEADPNTFEQLHRYFWKDEERVFFLNHRHADFEVKGADAQTAQVIDESYYLKDQHHVYYTFYLIENADAASFERLEENFARDKKSHFYQSKRIDSMEYSSMQIINDYYSLDSKHLFYEDKLVEDADPNTFCPDGIGFFGHDDKNMFDGGENKGPITAQYRKKYIDKPSNSETTEKSLLLRILAFLFC